MANAWGANYDNHPMVTPICARLGGIEQQLGRLDRAVTTILQRLGLPLLNDSGPKVEGSRQNPESPPTSKIPDEPYIFQPPDFGRSWIRLFALNCAGQDTDTISGQLVHVSLEDPKIAPKRHNALSYTWGELKIDHLILINGHLFQGTRNLESAWRHMRKKATKKWRIVQAFCCSLLD